MLETCATKHVRSTHYMEQKVMIDMNNREKPLFSTEGMFSMLRKRTAPATLAESKAQLEDSP
jgi:hypothetical protein